MSECVFEKLILWQYPLLHFQTKNIKKYDSEFKSKKDYNHYLCLRATEVKPRLDKFILNNYSSKLDADMKYGEGDNISLKYKLSITIAERYPNNDKIKKVFNTSTTYIDCKLRFVCFNQKLRDIINDSLSDFFIVTNFGRVKKRGFGSFILNDAKGSSTDYYRGILDKYFDVVDIIGSKLKSLTDIKSAINNFLANSNDELKNTKFYFKVLENNIYFVCKDKKDQIKDIVKKIKEKPIKKTFKGNKFNSNYWPKKNNFKYRSED